MAQGDGAVGQRGDAEPIPAGRSYKGFVAGTCSGLTKCLVGHPFDTVKVRLQTTSAEHFKGPLDCLLVTVRNEGVLGLYKGVTPPLIGWMFMDSLLLGSLTVYRNLLNNNVFNPAHRPSSLSTPDHKLPTVGHGLAGICAGWTVSIIAAPIEHVKARLQIQYAEKSRRLYSGPIDCARKLLKQHGIAGLWHGYFATTIFRTFFFFWWSSYNSITLYLQRNTSLSAPAINFWAGGLSAQIFWLTSYPSDVVKQRIMTDPLGKDQHFKHWTDAARAVWRENGFKGYWRGFLPCFLRSFPANSLALVAFEGVMRTLP